MGHGTLLSRMSQVPLTGYAQDTLNGEKGIRTTNALFISDARMMHLVPHQIMLDSRRGIQKHGIWEEDEGDRAVYGNLMMKIISCADRAWARVQRNSARVVSTSHAPNGTSAYVVRVSTTHTIGRSVIPMPNGAEHVRWVDTVCLVVGIAGNTAAGVAVRPLVTCFPIAT